MMNMYYPGTAGRVVILDEMIEQRLPNMTGFPSNKLQLTIPSSPLAPAGVNVSLESSLLTSVEELRTFEWIQSVTQEDFELMKNISYLEQFFDMNEDLSEKELAHLDLAEFIGFFDNQNNNDEHSQADSMHSNHSADGEEDVDDDDDDEDDDDGHNDSNHQNEIVINGDNQQKDIKNVGALLSEIEKSHSGEPECTIIGKNQLQQQQKNQQRRSGLSSSSMDSGKDEGGGFGAPAAGKKKYYSSLQQLAQDQFVRISKYGDIALNAHIARKNPKSDDFYDQEDSFIDDDQVDTELKQLAICNADYDDFFMIDGGLDELVKCSEFKQRLLNIQEYRDTKKLESHLNEQDHMEKKKHKKQLAQLEAHRSADPFVISPTANEKKADRKNVKKHNQTYLAGGPIILIDDEEDQGKQTQNRRLKKQQKTPKEQMNATAAQLKLLSKQPSISKLISQAGAMHQINEETSGYSRMIPEFSNGSLVGIDSNNSRANMPPLESAKIIKKQLQKSKKLQTELPIIAVLPVAAAISAPQESLCIETIAKQVKRQYVRKSAPAGTGSTETYEQSTNRAMEVLVDDSQKASHDAPAGRFSENFLRVSVNLSSGKKAKNFQSPIFNGNGHFDDSKSKSNTLDAPSLVKPIIRRSGSSRRSTLNAAAADLSPHTTISTPTVTRSEAAASSKQRNEVRSKSMSSSKNEKKKQKNDAQLSSPAISNTRKTSRSISQISNSKIFLEDNLPELLPKRKIVKSKGNLSTSPSASRSSKGHNKIPQQVENTGDEQSRQSVNKSTTRRSHSELNNKQVKKPSPSHKKGPRNQKRKREVHIEEEVLIRSEKSDRRRK